VPSRRSSAKVAGGPDTSRTTLVGPSSASSRGPRPTGPSPIWCSPGSTRGCASSPARNPSSKGADPAVAGSKRRCGARCARARSPYRSGSTPGRRVSTGLRTPTP